MAKKKSGDHDDLTGLQGYNSFMDALDESLKAAIEDDLSLSAALVDVDMFKQINEDYGHETGDEVLKLLSSHLVTTAPDGGRIFRFSGDEFMVLMPGIEKEQAFLLMENARSEFDREHTLTIGKKKTKLIINLSTGVAAYPDDGKKVTDIVRKACDAVYRAKASGRNKVALAREERMVTKTSHYTQGQLDRLSKLAKREGVGEANILREALDDQLRKFKQ